MRYGVIVSAVLALAGEALPENRQVTSIQPNQFEIGRRTFFDFGPACNYDELFIVRLAASGASIEGIIVAPPGNAGLTPEKVEIARASIDESNRS
jgi:hypothetical protein